MKISMELQSAIVAALTTSKSLATDPRTDEFREEFLQRNDSKHLNEMLGLFEIQMLMLSAILARVLEEHGTKDTEVERSESKHTVN